MSTAIIFPVNSRLPDDFEMSEGLGPPPCPGVYAVCVRNRLHHAGAEHIIYIGAASDVRRRVTNPRHYYRIAYDRLPGLVYTRTWATDDYLRIEKEQIRQLRPILNIQHRNG